MVLTNLYLYIVSLTKYSSHRPQPLQTAAYAEIVSHTLRHASEIARSHPENTTAWKINRSYMVVTAVRRGIKCDRPNLAQRQQGNSLFNFERM